MSPGQWGVFFFFLLPAFASVFLLVYSARHKEWASVVLASFFVLLYCGAEVLFLITAAFGPWSQW